MLDSRNGKVNVTPALVIIKRATRQHHRCPPSDGPARHGTKGNLGPALSACLAGTHSGEDDELERQSVANPVGRTAGDPRATGTQVAHRLRGLVVRGAEHQLGSRIVPQDADRCTILRVVAGAMGKRVLDARHRMTREQAERPDPCMLGTERLEFSIRHRTGRIGENMRRGGPGTPPGTADGGVPSVEPESRCGQAAFGNVSLTALKLSTTTSLSSVPVSR